MPENISIAKLLEKVVDQMLEGLQVINRDWRYLYVNETVAKQGRSTKEQLLGRTMMECYPGIDQTPLFKVLKSSMEEQKSHKMDNEFTFPDGQKGWFELYIQPVNEGIMILSVDVTDRKLAEIKLQERIKQVEQLSQSLNQRKTEFQQLQEEISALKELASQMISARVEESLS